MFLSLLAGPPFVCDRRPGSVRVPEWTVVQDTVTFSFVRILSVICLDSLELHLPKEGRFVRLALVPSLLELAGL